MTIEWGAIFQSTLVSGLISAGIGYLFYFKQKKIDSDFNFRNYILDKRKNVYNKIETVLAYGYASTNLSNGSVVSRFILLDYGPLDPFSGFNNQIMEVLDSRYWVSDEMFKYLTDLNMIVVQGIKEVFPVKHDKAAVQKIGARFLVSINNACVPIASQYFKDLQKLNDIDIFKHKKVI